MPRHDRWPRLCFAWIASISTVYLGAGAPARSSVRAPTSFSFNLDPKTHKIFVEGRLTGARSKLLLDTGAPNSYLHDTLATELGAPLETAVYNGEPFFLNGQPLEYVMWPHTVIGTPGEFSGFDLGNMFYYLLPGNKVPGNHVLHEDGILGANAFEQNAILLDFQSGLMMVWPGGDLSSEDLKTISFERAYMVSIFKSIENTSWTARVRITNASATVPCDLIIDTGADYSYLPANVAKRLSLTSHDTRHVLGGFNQSFTVNTTDVPELRLGDLTINDLPINYLDHEVAGFTGSIGMDILSKSRVLIDYPAHRMYLVPSDDVPRSTKNVKLASARSGE